MDEGVPAGGVVMVDVVDEERMALTNQCKKKLMPVPTLKPRGMIQVNTNTSAQPRKPSIGNS